MKASQEGQANSGNGDAISKRSSLVRKEVEAVRMALVNIKQDGLAIRRSKVFQETDSMQRLWLARNDPSVRKRMAYLP